LEHFYDLKLNPDDYDVAISKKCKRVCRKHDALKGVTLAVPEGKIVSNEEDKKVTG
jgi:hypothetical protein